MENISKISFPGLGIGQFDLNRVFLEIGPFTLYWYGVIICLAMVCGFSVAYKRMKKLGVTLDSLTDYVLACVPSAIVGARLYYVLAELDKYHSFYDVIAVWEGGLAIYGGIIAGAAAFVLVCRHHKKNVFAMCDAAAPGLILGQIIGRWGNFFNAEAFGSAATYEFLGKTFDITEMSKRNPLRMTIDGQLVHPTFLYECLWNIVGFVLMNLFFEKKKFNGEVLLWYLSWYGLGRSLIEGLRTDSLTSGGIRISQLLALLCFAVGVTVITVVRIKMRKERKIENGNNN